MEDLIEAYEQGPAEVTGVKGYLKTVIKALENFGNFSLAEDLEDFDPEDAIQQQTLHEAIEWLKRHGKND